jgi:hypothetical protein
MFADEEVCWLLLAVAVDCDCGFPIAFESDVLAGRGLVETLRFGSGSGF